MAEQRFSYKEAIVQGFRMTKKYFGTIMLVILIFAAFEISFGLLNSRAGFITDESARTFYTDRKLADDFHAHLVKSGYINIFGSVQAKLQNMSSASELTLPVSLELDRDKIFKFLDEHKYRLPFPKSVYFLLAVALWAVSVLMQIGLVKISLLFGRDQKPALSELFSSGPLFFKYLSASVCYGLAILGGIILLIIPGIIFGIALGMYLYLIVDKNMGPIQSLKESRALTKGARWQLFCFGMLLTLVNIGGLLCLVVGLLFTIPASYIASAYVYDQLRKQYETAVGPAGEVVK